MASHQSQASRINEIVEAAAIEIAHGGLRGLTMERIVARTSLSKGGVYRFFSNLKAVLLEVLDRVHRETMSFSLDKVTDLSATPTQIFSKLWANIYFHETHGIHWGRVWLQLLPETLSDEDFSARSIELQAKSIDRLLEVLIALVRLNGQTIEIDEQVRVAMRSGMAFGAGLMIASLQGMSREELEEQLFFIADTLYRAHFHPKIRPATAAATQASSTPVEEKA